jgi:voltage-gated potassium channel
VNIKRRTTYSIIAVIGVIAFGTAGYIIIEKWSFIDAFYMTVITLTTVGYGEVHTLSKAGRIFSIVLMLSGVGTVFYILGVFARILLEGEVREILGRKRLNKKIESLKNHYIICGYGRMGSIICKELMQNKAPFVVIEGSPEVVATMDPHILSLQGDATQDSILKQAGIERARGLYQYFHLMLIIYLLFCLPGD